jgi:hypothetical protein
MSALLSARIITQTTRLVYKQSKLATSYFHFDTKPAEDLNPNVATLKQDQVLNLEKIKLEISKINALKVRGKRLYFSTCSSLKDAVLENCVIVDKSSLIKEIMDDPDKELMLTFPRRWGKSFSLDLIRRFFEIEVDPQGDELREDLKINKRLFENAIVSAGDSNSRVREPMNILHEIQLFEEHFGKYPVVYFNLSGVIVSERETVAQKLACIVSSLYSEYAYLENSKRLEYLDKQTLRFVKSEEFTKLPDHETLTSSIETLVSLLFKHFQQPVLLLVDDFDVSISNAFRLTSPYETKKTIELIKSKDSKIFCF